MDYVESKKNESSTAESEIDCFQEMRNLKMKYPKNIIVSYININSFRNKFDSFYEMIREIVDILIIAETKLNSSFPKDQFLIPGYKRPERLDVSESSGGLLVYIKEGIIHNKLGAVDLGQQIQFSQLK